MTDALHNRGRDVLLSIYVYAVYETDMPVQHDMNVITTTHIFTLQGEFSAIIIGALLVYIYRFENMHKWTMVSYAILKIEQNSNILSVEHVKKIQSNDIYGHN